MGGASSMLAGKALDLFDPVLQRNGDQNRLIKSAPHHFYLPAPHQGAKALEIFRMRALDPFEQRTGLVQASPNGRMLLQNLHERQV